MKKLIYLLITLSVLIILSSCVKISVTPPDSDSINNISQTASVDTTGSAENTDAKDTEKINVPENTKAPETTQAPETTKAPEDNYHPIEVSGKFTQVTVPETVLVDEKDVKITLKGFEIDTDYSAKLKLTLENNTDQKLNFTIENAVINGYMVSCSLYTDVAAGKKANDYITIYLSSLALCDIYTIASIELSFDIMTSDFKDYFVTDLTKVETSAAKGFVYNYDDSGIEIYNKNDIRVVAKGLYKKDNYSKFPEFLLYVHNSSDKDISISKDDLSVNGYMIGSYLNNSKILSNKHSMVEISFDTSDFEENEISKIEEIEFKLKFYDHKTYNAIDTSDIITLYPSDYSSAKSDKTNENISSDNLNNTTNNSPSSSNTDAEPSSNTPSKISTASLPAKTGKLIEYSIPDFPGTIKVDSSYNVYSTTNDYTEEMCKAQGTDKAEMYLYLYMSSTKMAIYPNDALFDDPYFEIKISVIPNEDEDDKITIDSFKNLSSFLLDYICFNTVKMFTDNGYKAPDGGEISSDTFETDNALFLVFDCVKLYQTRYYVTVINDTYIIIEVSAQNQQLSDEQDKAVKEILKSFSY